MVVWEEPILISLVGKHAPVARQRAHTARTQERRAILGLIPKHEPAPMEWVRQKDATVEPAQEEVGVSAMLGPQTNDGSG